jgi:uncharacterized protein
VTHGPYPTVAVRRAVMHMHWDDLTFIHWPYPSEEIQRLLPAGLTAQTFDGVGYVSLVPFVMRVTTPHDRLRLPFVGCFPETNVRTYVTAADGTDGVWFFSLDAGSAIAVAGGRIGYRLPYMYSDMNVRRTPKSADYTCRRRLPGPSTATSTVGVDIGDPLADDELGELDHWLSARWRLYSTMFGRTWAAHAVHQCWPLRRASLRTLDDHLVTACGLPTPTGEPVVQFADRVTVRVGRPFRVRPT